MTPMATCASAAGGSIFAAAVAKRSVLVCKKISAVCAKMAVYTVRITGWALKRKS